MFKNNSLRCRALKTMEAFDPTDSTWREVQSMQTARIGPASVKYRDLIWVAGGMTKSKKELFSKDVECYDPIKNLLARSPSLKVPSCIPYFPLPRLNARFIAFMSANARARERELRYMYALSDG